MKKFNFQAVLKKRLLSVFLLVTILLIANIKNVTADEVPAFFLKIAKTIPRMGRSQPDKGYIVDSSNTNDDNLYFQSIDQINDVNKRKVGFSPESDTWNWQHFPLAIEGPPELWRSLAGYSHDPLYKVTDDFNNELWSRDKRTNGQAKLQI